MSGKRVAVGLLIIPIAGLIFWYAYKYTYLRMYAYRYRSIILTSLLYLLLTLPFVYVASLAFRRKSLPLIGATLCLLSNWLFGPINFMAQIGAWASCASAGCCACEVGLLIILLVAFPVGYAIGWAIDRVITNQPTGFVITIATTFLVGAVPYIPSFFAR